MLSVIQTKTTNVFLKWFYNAMFNQTIRKNKADFFANIKEVRVINKRIT